MVACVLAVSGKGYIQHCIFRGSEEANMYWNEKQKKMEMNDWFYQDGGYIDGKEKGIN